MWNLMQYQFNFITFVNNKGTFTVAPVSTVADLVAFVAVFPDSRLCISQQRCCITERW
jgi:Rps23 Pro-64 3,4-dihydroxylase Tpa1-like proline 4-hydroxylase